MRWLAILVLMGCGDVPASDVDGDGIADDDDECLATSEDDDEDVDYDGKDADVDLCPHDTNALAGDLDTDGIPDACDPFFDTVRPDTRRCTTTFAVRYRTASFMHARVGEQAWDYTWPLSAVAEDNVSIVSDVELEHPSTSFDLLASAKFANADDSSTFKLWLRAAEAPSPQDIACGVDGSGHLFVWAGNTRQAVVTLPRLIDGIFRLRATVGGANAAVLCRATVEDQSIATTLATTLAPGGYGFASAGAWATIHSLVIDSNDVPVPFRNERY